MSTVLVLGASVLQVPLIRAVRAAGHRVVAVDNVPDNPGHRDADASHDISTRDVDAVVAAARRERATAVLTCCSDVALPAAAAAQRALGLRGFEPELLERWHPKPNLRRFQRERGLPCPPFVVGDGAAAPEALASAARRLEGEVVVKPADRSGSRGVRRVPAADASGLSAAIAEAGALAFSGEVIVEGFVEGVEFGGDAWIGGGRVEALFPTRKDLQGAIVRGHRHPTALDPASQAALAETLEAHVRHAGYETGPLNFDVRITPSGEPVVLELAPRLGGNWIPQLVEWSTGVDLFGATVAAAVGDVPVVVTLRARPGASFVIGAGADGRLEEPIPSARIREAVPEVVELEIDLAPGDRYAALRDSGGQVGRALFDLGASDYEGVAAALEHALAPWLPPTRAAFPAVAEAGAERAFGGAGT